MICTGAGGIEWRPNQAGAMLRVLASRSGSVVRPDGRRGRSDLDIVAPFIEWAGYCFVGLFTRLVYSTAVGAETVAKSSTFVKRYVADEYGGDGIGSTTWLKGKIFPMSLSMNYVPIGTLAVSSLRCRTILTRSGLPIRPVTVCP